MTDAPGRLRPGTAGPGFRRLRLTAILALLLTAPLAAQGNEDEDNGQFFFGFNLSGGSFRGDFDGSLSLWHFEKAFAVPPLPQDGSLGLSFGRRTRTGLWEAVYLQASHNALWGERDVGVSLSQVEIRGKAWLLPRSPVKPLMFLGFGLPWLRVADGARMGSSTENTSFFGINLVLGAGVMVDLGSRLFLSAGAGYRLMWFLYAFGGGKGRDISKLTREPGGGTFARPLKATRLGLEATLGIRL